MSKIGYGYGSEWHLLRYLGYHRALLSQKVGEALGAGSVEWLDFPFAKDGAPLQDDREFRGLEFLSPYFCAKGSGFYSLTQTDGISNRQF